MGSPAVWNSLFCFAVLSVVCLLPIILLAIAAFIGLRRGRAFLDTIVLPDPAELHAKFDRLQAENSGLNTDDLVRKIIHQEALKCGSVGFVTGVGGIPFMALTVPIDAVASMRIQAMMIQFIARAYGQGEQHSDAARLKTYLILAGSEQLTAVTASIIRSVLIRTLLKSIFEIVPFLGGIVGFAANYVITRSVGEMAVRWYHGDLQKYGLNTAIETMTRLLEEGHMLRPAPAAHLQLDVASAHAAPEPPSTANPPTAQPTSAATIIICHECQAANREVNSFCQSCGTALT